MKAIVDFLETFLAEHPKVALALAALLAAIFEAITGAVEATGGQLPTP